MSRVALTETVLLSTNPASYARGYEVYVYDRGTTEEASVYSAESGGSEVTQPLETDRGGRPRGPGEALVWLEVGSYDLKINGQTVPWEAADGEEEGGAVASVNGKKGVVVLGQSDISGLETALGNKQPLDSDLTAIAALTTTEFGRAFLALANAAAGRTALGLGTAAVEAATAFQPVDSDLTAIAALTTAAKGRELLTKTTATQIREHAESAAAVHTHAESDVTNLVTDLAAKQPLDSDLTAIAALTTTEAGRALLAKSSVTTIREYIEAQPVDGDLTAIAALTTTSFGRELLTKANAAAVREAIGSAATSEIAEVKVSGSGSTSDSTVDSSKEVNTKVTVEKTRAEAAEAAIPASVQPQLVLPDVAMQPFVNGVGAVTANRLMGVTATCQKAGTLDKLSIYIGGKAGKVICAVYDTGQANAGEYTRLATSGEVEVSKEKEWQEIFNPALTVTKGQVLLFTLITNTSTTLTIGRHGSAATSAGAGTLPSGYLTGMGSGVGSKLLGRREVGAFEAPTKVTYANLDDTGETIAHAIFGHIT